MRAEGPQNWLVTQKPRIDLDGILSKNLSKGWVSRAREFAKSVIEICSKMHEPKTYNEAINNAIYGNRWQEAIDKELWNLDSHQIWTYTPLPIE